MTPYNPQERYAAGEYPNQHPTGDGLPSWTKANRKVDDTEISLWYVFGHNHVPRPEDWPVMPVAMLGFQFRPDGFFERSRRDGRTSAAGEVVVLPTNGTRGVHTIVNAARKSACATVKYVCAQGIRG